MYKFTIGTTDTDATHSVVQYVRRRIRRETTLLTYFTFERLTCAVCRYDVERYRRGSRTVERQQQHHQQRAGGRSLYVVDDDDDNDDDSSHDERRTRLLHLSLIHISEPTRPY